MRVAAKKTVVAEVNVHYEGRIIFAGDEVTDLPDDVVASLLATGGAKEVS
jgi:hypothetical protein